MNPNCTGLIGNGVVVHLPSFFEELDALESQGLNCSNRLFISDRAQLVFDFHQIVDGLKEVELGGSRCESVLLSIILFRRVDAGRSGVASGLRRRVLALHIPGRHPDLAFESTISLTMDPSPTNSASWSKADTNDTGISNMIPKEKYFDTRSILKKPHLFSQSDELLSCSTGTGDEVETVRRR